MRETGGERCCSETLTPIRCTGTGSDLSIRVMRADGSGGAILATNCDRAPSKTIGACVKFILVDIETNRAGLVLGKYWPFFASVESPATEISRSTTHTRNDAGAEALGLAQAICSLPITSTLDDTSLSCRLR